VEPSAGARTTALGADIAGGTRPVLDDERLAEALRQPVTDQAREDVGPAASGKGGDHAHRPRGVDFRPSHARHSRQRGSARGQMQELAAGKFHFEPPLTSFDHLVGAHKQ
jgi:hypothetical protein